MFFNIALSRELLLKGKVDLLTKIGCFVKMEKYSFSMKSEWSKLVRIRRSIVLILPLQ